MIEQKQAIKDMIDFIAEFELWLEGEEQGASYEDEWHPMSFKQRIKRDVLGDVLENYRRCKKRIEYDDNGTTTNTKCIVCQRDMGVFRAIASNCPECTEWLQSLNRDDEQPAHVLTAEQAEVLETIHESPANSPRDWNIIAMWLHEQGYIGTYPDGLSIRFFRAKSGRDALKTYQDSHNDE